jgi:hypothetical protein
LPAVSRTLEDIAVCGTVERLPGTPEIAIDVVGINGCKRRIEKCDIFNDFKPTLLLI